MNERMNERKKERKKEKHIFQPRHRRSLSRDSSFPSWLVLLGNFFFRESLISHDMDGVVFVVMEKEVVRKQERVGRKRAENRVEEKEIVRANRRGKRGRKR